jgi:anti-sigma B factor antagonist
MRCDMGPLRQDETVASGGSKGSTVAVRGEVDASNADRVRLAILAAAAKHGAQIEVNLAEVIFMDSTGLRAIADASSELERSGSSLVLSHVPRQVLRLLEIADVGPLEIRR